MIDCFAAQLKPWLLGTSFASDVPRNDTKGTQCHREKNLKKPPINLKPCPLKL
ncbi:MAG: hypothetical protein M1383_04880 [Patescibacteria group bacterium]|nr:hypothetical protein [Patescibacteria group bacterium]